jgi:peptidoglycan/xylan/chitin deacetylase (PgdA/CDA1 family)
MMKSFIKKIVYRSGMLPLLHRKNNRHALTVVLFHRVLPVHDPRWTQADMDWAVSDNFFRDCLDFFRRHYTLVSLRDVETCYRDGTPLPDCPLLITFDDGWLDNLEYALPIARSYNTQPLLFVTTDAIGQPMLGWQETLYSAWRVKALPQSATNELFALIKQDAWPLHDDRAIHRLIEQLQNAGDVIKNAAAQIAARLTLPHPVQMLNAEQLRQLGNGFDFGTHGLRHEPLTQAADPQSELQQAREKLSALTHQALPVSMSFPHGRCNDDLMRMAKDAGYTLIFTGIECHNAMQKKSHAVFGRFNINQQILQDRNGRLLPELMALYLFRRPVKSL